MLRPPKPNTLRLRVVRVHVLALALVWLVRARVCVCACACACVWVVRVRALMLALVEIQGVVYCVYASQKAGQRHMAVSPIYGLEARCKQVAGALHAGAGMGAIVLCMQVQAWRRWCSAGRCRHGGCGALHAGAGTTDNMHTDPGTGRALVVCRTPQHTCMLRATQTHLS